MLKIFKSHKLFKKQFYIFLAVLVLCHCLDFSLAVMSGDHSPAAMHWLLIAVTSLVEKRGL